MTFNGKSRADAHTLEHVHAVRGETLVALAARFGAVRLIDNVFLYPPESGP